MSYTRDWLENKPIDHRQFQSQPGDVRAHKIDVADRLKNIFFGWISGEAQSSEGVKQLPFQNYGGTAGSAANALTLIGSGTGGKTELWGITEDGTKVQYTALGKLLVAALADSGTLGTGVDVDIASLINGPLGVDLGGLGTGVYTIGDLIFADGTGSLALIPIGTAGYGLAVDGTGTNFEYKQFLTEFPDSIYDSGWTSIVSVSSTQAFSYGTTLPGLPKNIVVYFSTSNSGNGANVNLLNVNSYSDNNAGCPVVHKVTTTGLNIDFNNPNRYINDSGTLQNMTTSHYVRVLIS